MTPTIPQDTMRRRARLAYELGRLKVGAIRALVLVALLGATTFLSTGSTGSPWLALTALVWLTIEWRGAALLRGGRIGAALGLVALTIPLWAFRTCCRAGDSMMGADCCSMSGACTAIGLLIGLTLAVFLVRAPRTHRAEQALGMSLALLAVASLRCAELLAGEALGLLGGLAAGALASSLVAMLLSRTRRTV